MKLHTYKLILAIFLFVGIGIIASPTASAAYCDRGGMGRAGCVGFHSGVNGQAYACHDGSPSGEVGNVISGGMYTNSASEFINRINNKLYGSGRDPRGASFIIHAVLGEHGNRTVQWSKNNFSRFSDTVNAYASAGGGYGIDWNTSRSSNTNSAHFSSCGVNDAAFHEDSGSAAVIRFYWPGGNLDIERACGNLRGSSRPPNPVDWDITASTDISGYEGGSTDSNRWVTPGGTLTWKHNGHNNGPTPTNRDIVFQPQLSSNGGSSYSNHGGSKTRNSGWPNGANAWSGSDRPSRSQSIGANQNGTKYCERVRANRTAHNNNNNLFSNEKCATVYNRWRMRVYSPAATYTDSNSNGVATPGEVITWKHYAGNTGQDNTSENIVTTLISDDIPAGATTQNPADIASGRQPLPGSLTDNLNHARTYKLTRTYTIQSSDAGKNLCQQLRVNDSEHMTPLQASSGSHAGANRCVYVPYDYELTPSIDNTADGIPDTSESGMEVTVNPLVNNSGPTRSESTSWQVHRLVYSSAVTPDPNNTGAGNSSTAACGYYSSTDRTACDLIDSDPPKRVFNPGDTPLTPSTDTIPDLVVGSTVCYVLSIQPWKNQPGVSGGADWRHSDRVCMVVSKRPKIHVVDGDTKVRGVIDVNTSKIGTRTYGGWVDYGVFSTLQNGESNSDHTNALASGAGLRQGRTGNSGGWSNLTFTNTAAPYGNFVLGTHSSLHDYFMNQSQTQTAGSSLTLSGTGTKVINAGTNVTINASSIPVGGTFIVKATGTVTINGDITYDRDASISDPRDIPQVVVVAENIIIDNLVTRVDAWLLATGSINTCDEKTWSPSMILTASDCANELTVNGPISVGTSTVPGHLYLLRTAGASASDRTVAAETFRLDPASYLWLYSYANSADRTKTTYITELPPRF